jgi:hypothetical protein
LNYQTLPTYFPGPAHLLNLRTFVEADDHQCDEINDDNPISDGTMMLQPPNKITYEAHLTPLSLQIVLKEVAEYFGIDSKDLKAIIAHLKASRLTSSSLSRPDA